MTKIIRSLVVPARPPVDKFVAAKRVLLDWRAVPNTRFEIEFCDVNIPTKADYEKWDRGTPGSAVLVDVGDLKYHKGHQSASEMMKMMSHVEGGGTWNRLQEQCDQNNHTGFLKKRRHSVARMIREIYHLASLSPVDQERWQRICWAAGMDVVDSFFWRMDRRNWEDLFHNPQYQDLKRLWEGFNVAEEEVADFTVPLYFRKLFRSGRSELEIMQRMSFWLDSWKKVQRRHGEARSLDYRKYRDYQGFQVQGQMAAYVSIRNYFEAQEFVQQHLANGALALAIIRNPLGGMVIMPSVKHNWDFGALYHELDRMEPGCWYDEKRFSVGRILMNQSWQFLGIEPTDLQGRELAALISAKAHYGGRREKPASATAVRAS